LQQTEEEMQIMISSYRDVLMSQQNNEMKEYGEVNIRKLQQEKGDL
jgi:hypothetical protein